MFKVNEGEFATAAHGVLQETQDIRVAHERTKAALDAVLPTAAGAWYKTGSLMTSQFKRELGELKGELTKMSNTFGEASSTVSGTLLPQYTAVLSAAGGSSSQPNVACLDESVPVDGSYQYAMAACDTLANSIRQAQDALAGLENSESIGQRLSSLSSLMDATKARLEDTNGAFAKYSASVASFESTYAGRFDASAFKQKSLAVALNDGVKDVKGGIGVLKHTLSLGGTLGQIAGNVWEPSKTKPFVDSFVGKVSDWARPDKWSEAWHTASGATSKAASSADEVAEVAADAVGTASEIGTWGERASAAGKLVGYVGDGLAVVGIVTGAASTYSQTDGDDADKAAAATYEAVTGTAKFVTGKAVGAAVGTAVGGPLGTVVGFVAGCAVDLVWDYASDWAEDSGAKAAVIESVGSAYREAGKLISSGYDWFTSTFGFS